MGDRASVVIQEDPSHEVFLYTHWTGSSLPACVQQALARKQRWEDPSYLARIVFCTMIKGHESEETGYGISATLTGGSYPLIVLDMPKQQVRFEDEDTRRVIGKTYTFSQAAKKLAWPPEPQ